MVTNFQAFLKITSFANPIIKQILRLRDRQERLKTSLTVIDGIREVKAAIDAGILIKEFFVCPDLCQAQGENVLEILKILKERNVKIYEVTQEIFAKICFGDRAQGVLAIGSPRVQTIAGLRVTQRPFFMLVENVEKPGNLGAILRTADAVGIDAVFVSDPLVDIFNPNVIRASLGTVFSLKVIVETPQKILEFFTNHKVKLFAATPLGNKVYTAADYRCGIVVAVGSEKDGLSDFWLNVADQRIVIPMKGKANSLNTSVAAAVVLYEAFRQRQRQGV